MPLQGSGTISLNDIRNEFGGSNPISLSQYYRGGGRVPNTGQNANIPTSGTISFSQFYGAAAYTPMSLSKSGDASGDCFDFTACTATTNVVTITVSNGQGPFTYSWAHVGGAGMGFGSPSSATTTFNRFASVAFNGNPQSGTARCTVTDATAAQATIDVTVNTNHFTLS